MLSASHARREIPQDLSIYKMLQESVQKVRV